MNIEAIGPLLSPTTVATNICVEDPIALLSEPTSLPRRLLGTAVNLSTIIRHGARSPLWALGWTESLKIGAGVGSVVNGHTTHIVRDAAKHAPVVWLKQRRAAFAGNQSEGW